MKYIFLDVDGTIIDHARHEIPANTIKAINEMKKDNQIFICSGRPMATAGFGADIKFDGFIASLGTNIYYKGKELIDRPFSFEEHKYIEEMAEQYQIELSYECKMKGYGGKILYKRAYPHREDAGTSYKGDPKYWYPIKDYQGEKVYKMMTECLMDNRDNYLIFAEKIRTISEMAIYTNIKDRMVAEVSPLGFSKGYGIQELADLGIIDMKETIGIGDSVNDITMLEICDIGIAMGNAPDIVKHYADMTTEPINEDGFYKAFQRLGLVK